MVWLSRTSQSAATLGSVAIVVNTRGTTPEENSRRCQCNAGSPEPRGLRRQVAQGAAADRHQRLIRRTKAQGRSGSFRSLPSFGAARIGGWGAVVCWLRPAGIAQTPKPELYRLFEKHREEKCCGGFFCG